MVSFKCGALVGLGSILLAVLTNAQSPSQESAISDKGGGKKGGQTEVNEDRLAEARLLLFSLSNEARSFRDQKLRARSLAKIADALWEVATEHGSILFREAWKAAEAADRESEGPPSLREEVLKLVAKRDRQLAEEFLQKLKTDQQETQAPTSANNGAPLERNLWELPEALEKRLRLAGDLLRAGDVEGALYFADPVLGSVTASTIDFLTLLREKSPTAADQRYAAMLANTNLDMTADANTISLLSAYIFTPRMYVIFHADGSPEYSYMPSASQTSVGQQLRLAFFQTAANVLLRPQSLPGSVRSGSGIVGKYMVVKRLLPLFERYAPKEIATAIRGQFESLDTLVSDNARRDENEWLRKGITSEDQVVADQESSLMDQIERAKTSDERDGLYFDLALLSLNKDDPKARDYVSKISESEFRNQAQAWVDWSLAISALKKEKVETALEIVRNGELTYLQRVWILTQSAKLLAKADRDRALRLLNDATTEARRIEIGTPERPRALLAIANAFTSIEPLRAWETTREAIKAANSTENFTGEGGTIVLTLSRKNQLLRKNFKNIPDFDVEGIFSKLSKVDLEQAIQLAGEFKGEAPRANALIAIARSALNDRRIAPSKTR